MSSEYVPVQRGRFLAVGSAIFVAQLAVGFMLLPVTIKLPLWLSVPVMFAFGGLTMKWALDLSRPWWKPVPDRTEWTEDRL